MPILERENDCPKTAKVCRKYQDSIGTLGMSRPLVYKNPNLDAKLNSQEISTATASGWRRIKLPEMAEKFRLIASFSIRVDRKTRRAVKEANLPGVHRGGARRKRMARSPSREFAVEPAETTSGRLTRLSKQAYCRQTRSPGASAAYNGESSSPGQRRTEDEHFWNTSLEHERTWARLSLKPVELG